VSEKLGKIRGKSDPKSDPKSPSKNEVFFHEKFVLERGVFGGEILVKFLDENFL